jgi:hypothetical protein
MAAVTIVACSAGLGTGGSLLMMSERRSTTTSMAARGVDTTAVGGWVDTAGSTLSSPRSPGRSLPASCCAQHSVMRSLRPAGVSKGSLARSGLAPPMTAVRMSAGRHPAKGMRHESSS